MKKEYSVSIAGIMIVGIILSLSGMVLASQAMPAEKQQRLKREAPKPIPAANIEIVKKVFLPEGAGEIKGRDKGKPSSPKTGGAATGILGEQAVGNKYAVVIGICDYPGTDLDLCQSDGDSLHMYKALTELYGYEPKNIWLFKDSGGTTGSVLGNAVYGIPTRDNIYEAIRVIKEDVALSPEDEVVFFFSGHGTRGIAADGDEEIIDEAIVVWGTGNDIEGDITYIWDGELRDWFSGFSTTRIAFVFDSCLAGGMNDVASSGRIVNMATDETRSAYVYSTGIYDIDGDGINDGEGVFSHFFVNEGMLQGLADVYDHDNDATFREPDDVAVEEAFDYGKKNIPGYLKRLQKPVISDNFFNDLLL